MFTQQVTAGFFEAHSLWIPAFMAIDKLYWFPIHSLVLMFDQLHCRPVFSVLPAHCWPGVKNFLSWLLGQFMSGNALPFVGNLYVYLIVFANTFQIQTKYHIHICTFSWFSFQIHKILVFKHKYAFEPNPDCNVYYWYRLLLWIFQHVVDNVNFLHFHLSIHCRQYFLLWIYLLYLLK